MSAIVIGRSDIMYEKEYTVLYEGRQRTAIKTKYGDWVVFVEPNATKSNVLSHMHASSFNNDISKYIGRTYAVGNSSVTELVPLSKPSTPKMDYSPTYTMSKFKVMYLGREYDAMQFSDCIGTIYIIDAPQSYIHYDDSHHEVRVRRTYTVHTSVVSIITQTSSTINTKYVMYNGKTYSFILLDGGYVLLKDYKELINSFVATRESIKKIKVFSGNKKNLLGQTFGLVRVSDVKPVKDMFFGMEIPTILVPATDEPINRRKVDATNKLISAEVSGTASIPYQVNIFVAKGAIVPQCSCAHFRNRNVTWCKHSAAVLKAYLETPDSFVKS